MINLNACLLDLIARQVSVHDRNALPLSPAFILATPILILCLLEILFRAASRHPARLNESSLDLILAKIDLCVRSRNRASLSVAHRSVALRATLLKP